VILLIDNYDSFTWNLVQGLAAVDDAVEIGRDLVVVRNDEITADAVERLDGGRGPTHIVISPGPGRPEDAGVSAAVIERFAGRVPILAVCLGHQCLAASHGMKVVRHAIQMHGKTSQIHHDGKGVFAGLANPFTAMRYHSLVVDEGTVPKSGVGGVMGDRWEVSAWAEEEGESGGEGEGGTRRVVMGLRRVYADATKHAVEGVQFHPESFMTAEGPRLLKNFVEAGRKSQ
jgi:anthranilate synthase/aminodeoxychorismate synthase-like glutamine amidotransferase